MQTPKWDDGVPWCDERCPEHDGKRCELLGHRPESICIEAVKAMGPPPPQTIRGNIIISAAEEKVIRKAIREHLTAMYPIPGDMKT
jgi:hypothetical protein